MTIIRNFKHLFSSLLLAAAIALPSLPARAQLDPRLQTTKTDFLDLFQQSASLVVKPEMLTLFDFSGSMHAVYWDARYYANAGESATASSRGSTRRVTGSSLLASSAIFFSMARSSSVNGRLYEKS